jgi:plasmid stabilization system protein ParE
MPRGDKSKYSAKQKREAKHIEEGYERKGVSEKESKRRAWATVNKVHGGGAKGGSGSDQPKRSTSLKKSNRKRTKKKA